MVKILPISDFVRKFGVYADLLPRLDAIILTREGRPFAKLQATDEAKAETRKKYAGILAGTSLDSDRFWAKVLEKKSRTAKIEL